MIVPRVSVLMPVYNTERYLAAAVDSILAQTYTDFELIALDDGSTDGSGVMLEGYAQRDERVRVISRPNRGLVASLNEMIGLARGEYLARMDADDISLPDRFEKQVMFLDEHPEVVCVGGAFELIDFKGRLLTCLQPPCTNEEIQKTAQRGHAPMCHPSVMMRADAVLSCGGYEDLCPAEDLDLWLRIGEIGCLANLSTPLLRYRLHGESISESAGEGQRKMAREVCERAWARRGIDGVFEADEPWRPEATRASRYKFMRRYGWWAFNYGQRRTAMIYGAKTIAARPWGWEGWKLLACSAIKPVGNGKQ